MSKDKENSFLSKCAYGVADIYGGGAFVIIGTFFTVFLTKAFRSLSFGCIYLRCHLLYRNFAHLFRNLGTTETCD